MGLFGSIWNAISEPVGEEGREHVDVQKEQVQETVESSGASEPVEARGIVEDAYSAFSNPETSSLDRVEEFVNILQAVPLERRNVTVKQLLSTDTSIEILQSEALERRDAIMQAADKHKKLFEVSSKNIENEILDVSQRMEEKRKEIADFIKEKQQELSDYIAECEAVIAKLKEKQNSLSTALTNDLKGAEKEIKRLDGILSVLEEG